MILIKENQKKYIKEPINATINNNKIIPGLSGIEVNVDESYLKMKKVNTYSETLLVFNQIKPTINLNNNLDKLIVQGNPINKNISILLKINNLDILSKTLNLDENLNFIFSNEFIKKNYSTLSKINNNILSETNNDLVNYCYTTLENIKNICQDKQMILPTFITHNYYFETNQILENGKILAYTVINENNIQDINNIINNIKNLGYKIVSLDELLKE